jgi:hypothetical protein
MRYPPRGAAIVKERADAHARGLLPAVVAAARRRGATSGGCGARVAGAHAGPYTHPH